MAFGIYIHIPFCRRKCSYCDFLSAPATDETIEKYVNSLETEIQEMAGRLRDVEISSVFFGGGTPSIMKPAFFKRIMGAVRGLYRLSGDCEISVECNPGTLDEGKLAAYKEAGVNRLSIGLQSVHENELIMLGRIHDYKMFLDSYSLARRMGFDNINIDIMSGLPGQGTDDYVDTLSKVVELKPEHISSYSLIMEEGTPLLKMYEQGQLPRVADEDTERAMYYITKDILKSHGYERYEISNYALPGRECRHNILYWTRGSYVSFGIGAATFIGAMRYNNTRDIRSYIENPLQEKTDVEYLSKEDAMAEFMFLGMRMMKGVSKMLFMQQFGESMDSIYGPVLKKYEESGHIITEGDNVRLSEAGIDVSNVVFADFII